MSLSYDCIVVGSGVVGLAIASEYKRANPAHSVLVLEKEKELGKHASGRNSGVLHAGLYYPPGTLKARLCVEGAQLLREFCSENQLPFKEIGKVVLPLSEDQDTQIDLLAERAKQNKVDANIVSQEELAQIEPLAVSVTQRALYSPRTAIFDSKAVLEAYRQHAQDMGITISFQQRVSKVDDKNGTLRTSQEVYSYGLLVNSAGAYADRLAHSCEVGTDYVSMPFKGIYYKLDSDTIWPRVLVYPVPDLRVPFLGVHFTPDLEGRVSIGPSALPALGRENYGWFSGVDWTQVVPLVYRLGSQYLKNQAGFRLFANQELIRLFPAQLTKIAQRMIPSLKARHLGGVSKVGIRAQLYNRRRQALEMDFVVERGQNSIHILNAVSPGFTSSLSFARYVIGRCI